MYKGNEVRTYRYRNTRRWSLRPDYAFQGLSTRSSLPVMRQCIIGTIETSYLISF
jgi:hypothetical protein